MRVGHSVTVDTRATFQEAVIAVQTVSLEWIASHCGLRGNEIADEMDTADH